MTSVPSPSRPIPASRPEGFLEAILSSATDCGIITLDLGGRVTSWNEGAHRLLGWTETEMAGQPAGVFSTGGDGVPQPEMRTAADAGGSADLQWYRRKDGSHVWANGATKPLIDADGIHLGFLKILRDRTEQRIEAEKNRADAGFLRSVLASSADCIKVLDLDARLVFMSEGGQRVMEVSDFNSIVGCPWPDFWKHEGNAAARSALATALAGGIGRFQGMAETCAGNPRWWDVQVTAILDPDGRPERLLSVSRDISQAKLAEAQARLLGEELQHRVKNTMAMVQAIVRQTLRTASTPSAAQEAIEQRLAAMTRAQAMLTGGSWTSSGLRDIVDASLDLHDDRAGRFRVEGPAIRLNAEAAMSLALMLHELATNAAKYGSLSTPGGLVTIGWSVEPEAGPNDSSLRLVLTWREQGGPPVVPPTERGFGSRLIEQGLASSLRGKAVIRFPPEGVVCELSGRIDTSCEPHSP